MYACHFPKAHECRPALTRLLQIVPSTATEVGALEFPIAIGWNSTDCEGISGGPAGAVWGFLFVWIGTACVFTVLAELASMCAPLGHPVRATVDSFRAPTSGGQYHWVSMLAPPSMSKFLSYITGIFRPPGRQMPAHIGTDTWLANTRMAQRDWLASRIFHDLFSRSIPDQGPRYSHPA